MIKARAVANGNYQRRFYGGSAQYVYKILHICSVYRNFFHRILILTCIDSELYF